MWQGRVVKDDRRWTQQDAYTLMQDVVAAKLEQVPKFRDTLTKYAKKQFVEATTNTTWGSGVPLSSESAVDETLWTGKNLLGDIYGKYAKHIKA